MYITRAVHSSYLDVSCARSCVLSCHLVCFVARCSWCDLKRDKAIAGKQPVSEGYMSSGGCRGGASQLR
jgi:hypothetical protein